MNRDQVLRLQALLNKQGFGPLAEDGAYGPATARAYARFLRMNTQVSIDPPVPPQAKPWWTSRAVLGSVATIVAGAAGLAGWSVDAGGLTDALTSIVGVVAGLLAFWGTVRRAAPIDPTLVAPGVRRDGLWLRREPVPPDAIRHRPGGPFDEH